MLLILWRVNEVLLKKKNKKNSPPCQTCWCSSWRRISCGCSCPHPRPPLCRGSRGTHGTPGGHACKKKTIIFMRVFHILRWLHVIQQQKLTHTEKSRKQRSSTSGLPTKALTPPPLELSGHRSFRKSSFSSSLAFTHHPPSVVLVVGPLSEDIFCGFPYRSIKLF